MTADGSHSRLPGQPAQKDPGLEHGGGSGYGHGHGHGHGRGHGHGHGHGHHDSAMVDDLAMTTAAGIRASVIGLLGLLATALFQLALVGLTGSVALLSDTVHNLGDCLTALPIWLAFRLARRPATTRFTYGLGRVEDLAGLLVVAAIGASGVYAVFVSIDRLLHPAPVEHPWIVVVAGLVGVVGNEWVARYRIAAGRRIGSLALVADGEHARSDGLTSLAVVASGLASLVGWSWADPIVGLVIAALIGALFIRTGRAIVGRLMDAVDPDLVDRIGPLRSNRWASCPWARSGSAGWVTGPEPRSRSASTAPCRRLLHTIWPRPLRPRCARTPLRSKTSPFGLARPDTASSPRCLPARPPSLPQLADRLAFPS